MLRPSSALSSFNGVKQYPFTDTLGDFSSSTVFDRDAFLGESKPDPWVKVGTTTIDGTIRQVAEALLYGQSTNDDVDNNVGWIDSFVQTSQREPWGVGGRYLIARGSHINASAGTALIKCDIVRRLSECCGDCDREHLTDDQRNLHAGECDACCRSIEAKLSMSTRPRPLCPECGPHGNRGEVCLASSWAKCTTCNGGKAGDLWGRVDAQAEAPGLNAGLGEVVYYHSSRLLRDTGFDARQGLRGFNVPPLTGPEYATMANIERYCEADLQAASCRMDALMGWDAPLIFVRGVETDSEYRARIKRAFGT